MAYPTPPTLKPFAASDVPNLMENGSYDQQLTAIMNYLAQLGQYVDGQIASVRAEIPSSTDFATTEQLEAVSKTASVAASDAASAKETATQASSAASTASGEAQEASATASALTQNLSNLVGTLNNITVGSEKLIIGINADGTGTPTSPASESIMEEASSASTVAGEALTDAETANAAIGNWKADSGMLEDVTISKVVKSLSLAYYTVPIGINTDNSTVKTTRVNGIINFMGEFMPNLFQPLSNVIANLMLAAPNDDQEQVLGYLGDNTEDLSDAVKVRSSAALTAAYESSSGGPAKSPSDADLTSQDLASMRKTTDGFAYVG